ncbi:MAG: hypothetical protein HDT10_09285 [Helicobacter sp.]|nr:hypothetical protein [Helicobacter sp.]
MLRASPRNDKIVKLQVDKIMDCFVLEALAMTGSQSVCHCVIVRLRRSRGNL